MAKTLCNECMNYTGSSLKYQTIFKVKGIYNILIKGCEIKIISVTTVIIRMYRYGKDL